MKESMQTQIAWKLIEFLEALADLILEHYIDDSSDDNPIEEDLTPDNAWIEQHLSHIQLPETTLKSGTAESHNPPLPIPSPVSSPW
jgi:hypothetical protein